MIIKYADAHQMRFLQISRMPIDNCVCACVNALLTQNRWIIVFLLLYALYVHKHLLYRNSAINFYKRQINHSRYKTIHTIADKYECMGLSLSLFLSRYLVRSGFSFVEYFRLYPH